MEDNTLKFKEGQYILELKRYIDSTYTQHYSNKSGLQVQEILKDLEIGKEFCQGNAIKYLMRYGKKKGYNRADLFIGSGNDSEKIAGNLKEFLELYTLVTYN
jgi:hypothetical protein